MIKSERSSCHAGGSKNPWSPISDSKARTGIEFIWQLTFRDVTGKSIWKGETAVNSNFFPRTQQQTPQGVPVRN